MLSLIVFFPLFKYISFLYWSLILLCTTLVLFTVNPVFAVLSLVLVFILTSFCFMLLSGEYLGLIYIIVYVGAIAILFLFVLMLLNLRAPIGEYEKFSSYFYILVNICLIELINYNYSFYPLYMFLLSADPLDMYDAFELIGGDITTLVISQALFNIYFFYVIFCAFILLFVMVGVVLLLSPNMSNYKVFIFSNENKILRKYAQELYLSKILKLHDLQRK